MCSRRDEVTFEINHPLMKSFCFYWFSQFLSIKQKTSFAFFFSHVQMKKYLNKPNKAAQAVKYFCVLFIRNQALITSVHKLFSFHSSDFCPDTRGQGGLSVSCVGRTDGRTDECLLLQQCSVTICRCCSDSPVRSLEEHVFGLHCIRRCSAADSGSRSRRDTRPAGGTSPSCGWCVLRDHSSGRSWMILGRPRGRWRTGR